MIPTFQQRNPPHAHLPLLIPSHQALCSSLIPHTLLLIQTPGSHCQALCTRCYHFIQKKTTCFHLYPTLYPLKEQESNTTTAELLSSFGLQVCSFIISIYLLLLPQLQFELLSKVPLMQINKTILIHIQPG